jgi:ornithine--oxo-acid transaminase
LKVLLEEKMTENSERLGKVLLEGLKKMKRSYIKEIRGRGLFVAVEFDSEDSRYSAYDLCVLLKENGLLAKPTHKTTIRFSPPLVITDK